MWWNARQVGVTKVELVQAWKSFIGDFDCKDATDDD